MSMIRAIVELPAEAVENMASPLVSGLSDIIVDVLIDAFDTPLVGVLDLVEEGEPAWYRSSSF
jgi:hypothetical protein